MVSISAPTSLSTFPQAHASSSKNPHLWMNNVVGDSKSGLVGVQGDGIWIYDLTTLRATTSFTVPSSTVFTTAPISFWANKSVGEASQIKSGYDSKNGMDIDGDGETSEREEPAKEVKERTTAVGVGKEVWIWKGNEGVKTVARISKPVLGLHHLSSTLNSILVVSSSSQFFILSDSFEPQSLTVGSSQWSELLVSKVLADDDPESVRLCVVDVTGRIEVTRIWIQANRVETIKEGKIGAGKFVFGDISEDGVISVIDNQHNLYSTSLQTLSSQASPLKLLHPSPTSRLLSLHSPTLPLLLLSTNHPTPSLLLIVPSSSIPGVISITPLSSFSSSETITSLSILSHKGSVCIVGIVLSHQHAKEESSSGRSVLYICEVVIPERGIGVASLLGTRSTTEEYLQFEQSEKQKTEGEKRQDEVIKSIEQKIQAKDGKGAKKAWTDYAVNTVLEEKFVKRVLNSCFSVALTDEGKSRGYYAQELMRDIVERGIVREGMWKDSVVVDGLLPLHDWETIQTVLSKSKTISSSTLVTLITRSFEHNSSDMPLRQLLALILALPPPGPTYRFDLHKTLSVHVATAVLDIFTEWLGAHVEASSDLLIEWDGSVPKPLEDGLPNLQSLITHSSLLLDAHLTLFLSHSPCHPSLERMQTYLDPLIQMQNEYRQMRGPIEALLTLARREARKAEEKAQKKGGKRGKKIAGERLPEQVVGKWKVEEITF
ncbi:hypothetical protein L204_101646 [Cryptococcus depauperatus]|nr:hypothetical protein L204_04390 [Cryptococcus depauperatus CBS 7855]